MERQKIALKDSIFFQLIKNPYLASVLCSCLVGFSFLAIKIATRYASPFQLLTHRYNIAFLGLFVIILMLKKPIFKDKKIIPVFLTASFYILFMIFQTFALMYVTSIEAAIIFAVVPILVYIMARIFLNEYLSKIQIVFILLSMIALVVMVVLTSQSLNFNILGIVLLFISSFCMAINSIMMRSYREHYRPFEITCAIVFLGFVIFNIITVVNSIFNDNNVFGQYIKPIENSEFIIASAYLGIGCILLSAFLLSYVQSRIPAAKAAIFNNLSTAISFVAGALILNEHLYIYHIVCTVIIVISVIAINLKHDT